MDDKDYKQDSTRGKSIINPLNYKGDVLVQVWMDSRVLATMSNWLDGQEMYTRFMSQVVRRSMEEFCDALVNNHNLSMISHTGDARRLLERKYGVKLDSRKGGKGGKNKLHNLILSDRRHGTSESVSNVSPEEMDKMVKHMEGLIAADNKIIERSSNEEVSNYVNRATEPPTTNMVGDGGRTVDEQLDMDAKRLAKEDKDQEEYFKSLGDTDV